MRYFLPIFLLIFLAASSFAQTQPKAGRALSMATQLIVVTTRDWTSIHGVLKCYEREPDSDEWEPVSPPIAVTIGRTGLAWGRGLWDLGPHASPLKHEGDGKAPAGVFTLGTAFGDMPEDSLPPLAYPYQKMDTTCKCVDDSLSRYYNEVLSTRQLRKTDWSSAEEMKRPDILYHLGVIVNHNTDPRLPGGGSCIFLHIEHPDGSATTGCTSMGAEQIRTLISWLNADSHPLLVQMPEEEYATAVHLLSLPLQGNEK